MILVDSGAQGKIMSINAGVPVKNMESAMVQLYHETRVTPPAMPLRGTVPCRPTASGEHKKRRLSDPLVGLWIHVERVAPLGGFPEFRGREGERLVERREDVLQEFVGRFDRVYDDVPVDLPL